MRYSFQMETEAAAIEAAVETVLKSGKLTGDLMEADKKDAAAKTAEVGDAVCAALSGP